MNKTYFQLFKNVRFFSDGLFDFCIYVTTSIHMYVTVLYL